MRPCPPSLHPRWGAMVELQEKAQAPEKEDLSQAMYDIRMRDGFVAGGEEEEEEEKPKSRCKEYLCSFRDWLLSPSDGDVSVSPEGGKQQHHHLHVRRSDNSDEAPPRPQGHWIRRAAKTNIFEVIFLLCLIALCMVLGVDAACMSSTCSAETQARLFVVEEVFVGLFVVEWCLRFVEGGFAWLKSPRGLLDTTLVWLAGALVFWCLLWVMPSLWQLNRLFLGLHSLRGLRLILVSPVLRRFKTLRMLVLGMIGAAGTLLACCTLLATFVFMFAIIAREYIGGQTERSEDPSRAVFSYQQGIFTACLGVTHFIFNDNAVTQIEELRVTHPWSPLFCYGFMALAQFLILNLILAVIVDSAAKMMKVTEEELADQQAAAERTWAEALARIFSELDTDLDGEVSEEEFLGAFELEECRSRFLMMGIQPRELKLLFTALDVKESGFIDRLEFCSAMTEAKGQASGKSMLVAKKKAEKIEKRIQKYFFKGGSAFIRPSDEVTMLEDALTGKLFQLEETADKRLSSIEKYLKLSKRTARDLQENLRALRKQVHREPGAAAALRAAVLEQEALAEQAAIKEPRRTRKAKAPQAEELAEQPVEASGEAPKTRTRRRSRSGQAALAGPEGREVAQEPQRDSSPSAARRQKKSTKPRSRQLVETQEEGFAAPVAVM